MPNDDMHAILGTDPSGWLRRSARTRVTERATPSTIETKIVTTVVTGMLIAATTTATIALTYLTP